MAAGVSRKDRAEGGRDEKGVVGVRDVLGDDATEMVVGVRDEKRLREPMRGTGRVGCYYTVAGRADVALMKARLLGARARRDASGSRLANRGIRWGMFALGVALW